MFLYPRDLALLLGISVNMIYKIIQKKKVSIVSDGSSRKKLPPSAVRKILESRGFRYSSQIISLEGLKGGIGKTTVSIALTEGAARYGAKVLAIDLDMQGNLTDYLAAHLPAPEKVLVHVVKGDANIKDIIKQHSEYIDYIPSSLDNSRLELELNKSMNYKTYFKSLLSSVIDDYDLIVIDCPPTLSKVTTLATCASDTIIIPINADRDSMAGMKYQIQEITDLEKTFEIPIKYNVLWNKFDQREKLSSHYMQEIYSDPTISSNLLSIVMRTDTTYKNSKALKESIFNTKRSPAREDAEELVKELIGLNAWLDTKADKLVNLED